jgi:hypothetical protein
MKKTLLPLLLLAASAWLISLPACNKFEERLTIIQGRITEYGTDKPIGGARIYLLCYDGSVFGGSSSTLGDSIVTDANGEFHREYPQDDVCGGSYMIVWKEGYFKRDGLGVTTGINNVNIALDPEAWLKLVTIPDLGQWFSLGFGGTFSPHSVSADKGTESQVLIGRGGREIVLHWGPFSDPGIIYSDLIYLEPHDTTTYTIHY